MAEAPRISPEDARGAIARRDALLVCAYDDREKCEDLKLEGAIPFPELQQRLSGIEKDRELIFYCT